MAMVAPRSPKSSQHWLEPALDKSEPPYGPHVLGPERSCLSCWRFPSKFLPSCLPALLPSCLSAFLLHAFSYIHCVTEFWCLAQLRTQVFFATSAVCQQCFPPEREAISHSHALLESRWDAHLIFLRVVLSGAGGEHD